MGEYIIFGELYINIKISLNPKMGGFYIRENIKCSLKLINLWGTPQGKKFGQIGKISLRSPYKKISKK